jgi:hypothetical protein
MGVATGMVVDFTMASVDFTMVLADSRAQALADSQARALAVIQAIGLAHQIRNWFAIGAGSGAIITA